MLPSSALVVPSPSMLPLRTGRARESLVLSPGLRRPDVGATCRSSREHAVGGDDGLYQAVDDVVDVPGDRYARRDGAGGAQALDVVRDGRRRIEDGVLAQARLLGA